MVTGDGQSRTIRPRPPFRFDLALAYLSRSPLEVLDVVEAGVYRRALELGERPRLLEVRSVTGGERTSLRVSLPDGPATSAELDAAASLVARCFRVNDDMAHLDALAPADPCFGGLVQQVRGLRALIMPSAFEALVWAIIGQQINIAFAYKLKRVLVERLGQRLEHAGRVYHLFPSPERLAELDPEELRRLQFSGQKSRYVIDLSRLIARGELDLEALNRLSPDAARAELMRLRGIGRWTAEYVLIRGLGARDELPAADLGLQLAAGRIYGLDHRPTESELRTLAEPWAGWRAYYAFYLWFTLSQRIESSSSDGVRLAVHARGP
jgi:DNA-3-methyladenine glycosylase II